MPYRVQRIRCWRPYLYRPLAVIVTLLLQLLVRKSKIIHSYRSMHVYLVMSFEEKHGDM